MEELLIKSHGAKCRLKASKGLVDKILSEDFQSSSFEVTKFTLMKSTLTREGPVYNIVKDFDLI